MFFSGFENQINMLYLKMIPQSKLQLTFLKQSCQEAFFWITKMKTAFREKVCMLYRLIVYGLLFKLNSSVALVVTHLHLQQWNFLLTFMQNPVHDAALIEKHNCQRPTCTEKHSNVKLPMCSVQDDLFKLISNFKPCSNEAVQNCPWKSAYKTTYLLSFANIYTYI